MGGAVQGLAPLANNCRRSAAKTLDIPIVEGLGIRGSINCRRSAA